MPQIRDDQRVELALIPAMLQGIIEADMFYPKDKARLADLAKRAAEAPLADLPPNKYRQVHRRVTRLAVAAGTAFDNTSRVKVGMILYYFAEDLLSREVLEVDEGSPCEIVLREMIALVEQWDGFAEERLDRSAQKNARKLLGTLQQLGYFRDLPSRTQVA